MERTQLFDLMGELKLYGMKAAFDEIMATAVKRQHEPQRIVGDLLSAEISEKQARSIRYQLAIAKLPLAKDLTDFQFEGTPINETLVRDLANGDFVAQQRNAVLVGGTGTGKTHLAIAIARSCIRGGARGRFYNVVDLIENDEVDTGQMIGAPALPGQGRGQTVERHGLASRLQRDTPVGDEGGQRLHPLVRLGLERRELLANELLGQVLAPQRRQERLGDEVEGADMRLRGRRQVDRCPQARLGSLQIIGEQGHGVVHAEHRSSADHLVRQCLHPAEELTVSGREHDPSCPLE